MAVKGSKTKIEECEKETKILFDFNNLLNETKKAIENKDWETASNKINDVKSYYWEKVPQAVRVTEYGLFPVSIEAGKVAIDESNQEKSKAVLNYLLNRNQSNLLNYYYKCRAKVIEEVTKKETNNINNGNPPIITVEVFNKDTGNVVVRKYLSPREFAKFQSEFSQRYVGVDWRLAKK